MVLWIFWADFPKTMDGRVGDHVLAIGLYYDMTITVQEDFELYAIPWVPPMFFTLGNLNCSACEVFQKFAWVTASDCRLRFSVTLCICTGCQVLLWTEGFLFLSFFPSLFFSSPSSLWLLCSPSFSAVFPLFVFHLAYSDFPCFDSSLASNWFIRTWLTWWSWRDQGPQFDHTLWVVTLDTWLASRYGNVLWALVLLHHHQDNFPVRGTSKIPARLPHLKIHHLNNLWLHPRDNQACLNNPWGCHKCRVICHNHVLLQHLHGNYLNVDYKVVEWLGWCNLFRLPHHLGDLNLDGLDHPILVRAHLQHQECLLHQLREVPFPKLLPQGQRPSQPEVLLCNMVQIGNRARSSMTLRRSMVCLFQELFVAPAGANSRTLKDVILLVFLWASYYTKVVRISGFGNLLLEEKYMWLQWEK